MKKLLILLTSGFLASSVVPTISNTLIHSYQIKETVLPFPGNYNSDPTKPESLINLMANIIIYQNVKGEISWSKWENNDFTSYNQNLWDSFTKNGIGVLQTLSQKVVTHKSIGTYVNTFTNSSSNNQTFSSQSYSKTVTDTSSYSNAITVNLGFEIDFDFLIAGGNMTGSIGYSHNWSNSTSTSVTVTAPSSSFIVKGNSVGTVTTNIFQDTFQSNGLVAYQIPLTTQITSPGYYVSNIGYVQTQSWTLAQLIHLYNKIGYGNEITLTNPTQTIIKTDNPTNPTMAEICVPINWTSQGQKVNTQFSDN